ncbi:MAG TPA: acyl-CoA dehydrogenase family protein [Ramlibacter sp.]|nr:acyl-CoA dehydrogenase family protein [Ramlibacter sp.]
MNWESAQDDLRFILFDVLRADAQLAAMPAFADADRDLMLQVIGEAGKFVAEVVAPLNAAGDSPGCRWQRGEVTTPPGFREAYQAFWQGGWPALACAPADGGQGLPGVLEAVLYEMLSGANHGWTMAPALLHGAYDCLRHHGSEELKARYLAKIASGEWLATMCLTEAHAGSDLGLVRTRAVAQPNGSWRLDGSKIFISGGEHDLTDNIVHLVLARAPDAPAGPKGLSLFLVPKLLPSGNRNGVHCERIEEKMGLHGSPTCAMRFEDATGWLIGEPGRGLNAMFVMMNAARLHVALQGIGLLDAAWQRANAYSLERRQMRVPGPRDNKDAADPIGGHPAIRRILETQRAWVDGARVLAYKTAIELDIAKQHPDESRRRGAQRWCSLVTPVLKAAFTQQAFDGSSACLQVFGGHGYIREWGIEQIVRDSRVAMIYEGTNEIQAIDLLVRKVLADGGAGLAALLAELAAELDAGRAGDADVLRRFSELRELTSRLAQAAERDPALPFEAADDFLRATALALLAWAWARIEAAAPAGVARWRQGATALRLRVLPEFDMRIRIVQDQCAPHASSQSSTSAR